MRYNSRMHTVWQKGNLQIFSFIGLFLLLVMGVTVYYITESPSHDIRSFAREPKASAKLVKSSPKPKTATPQATPTSSPESKADMQSSDEVDAIEKDIQTNDSLLKSIDADSQAVLGISTRR